MRLVEADVERSPTMMPNLWSLVKDPETFWGGMWLKCPRDWNPRAGLAAPSGPPENGTTPPRALARAAWIAHGQRRRRFFRSAGARHPVVPPPAALRAPGAWHGDAGWYTNWSAAPRVGLTRRRPGTDVICRRSTN